MPKSVVIFLCGGTGIQCKYNNNNKAGERERLFYNSSLGRVKYFDEF